MTARNYAKTYNRKMNNSIPSGSIQFDKLFRGNSNRPSAAKSAGIVGKWGITSFTSLRNTNINGRCNNDSRGNHSMKRVKLDYANQNSHEKYSFPRNKNDEIKTDISKPKKFFKSRNMTPAIDQSKTNESIYESETNIDQNLDDKQQVLEATSFAVRRVNNSLDSSLESSCRNEGKPPIVLRICKGTAKLICSKELDSENLKNSSSLSNSNFNIDGKLLSQNIKSDKPSRIFHRGSDYLLSPHVSKLEMRTTRSRAKNLGLDVTSHIETPSIDTQNLGLSLTLRKSVGDSNNTLVSHYDIVKTDYTSSTNKMIKPNQFISSTKQLIDIPSCDDGAVLDELGSKCNVMEGKIAEPLCIKKENSTKAHVEKLDFKNIEISGNTNAEKNDTENEYNQEIIYKSDELLQNSGIKDNLLKHADQDWFSSSDDSESTGVILQNEISNDSQGLLSSFESSATAINKTVNKPALLKKGSIFKTRSTGTSNGNKRRALYKHKWSDSDKELKVSNADLKKMNLPGTFSVAPKDLNLVTFDEEFENSSLTRIITYPDTKVDIPDDHDNAVTSIRCDKKIKGFYTVVKNVKKAHQIQESGEFQEFNDDVEYILDTLRENNPNATRCLSAIRLASKCMVPAFRMHVRAHGTVAKFFKALHDATTDQSLALCTATVMFVLSQDRLAMDLDRDCLELMLSLLESDASHKNALDDCGLSYAELLKNKEKVRQLCADIQAQGHAKHLNLDNITVGQLAMETLLSLTSKRAGEWFKEELRELGGLEHIIKTITECHRNINSSNIFRINWDESSLDKLRKIDRCLRVLENVTHMNEENQAYLLKYRNSILVITLADLYNYCGEEILKYPTNDSNDKSSIGAVIRECLFVVIKVLINLTHRFNKKSLGGKTVGFQDRVIDNSLHLILKVPQSLPEGKRFDIMMLALILLINLIEQCEDNQKILIASKSFLNDEGHGSGLYALIHLFYEQEELARAEEQKTDAILDGKKDSGQSETISTTSKSQEEFIEETVAKLLQKAGRHMEHTLIGAYIVLLIGYLIMDNKVYENLVRNRLPDGTFATMITVLQKFFNFMNLTASNEISSCGIAATEKVIKFLQMSDVSFREEQVNLKLASEDVKKISDDILL